MSFLIIMIAVWAAAMGAWLFLSKYVKKSDVDRIKQRLAGTPKTKKAKGAQAGQPQVIQQTDLGKNRLAQMLVKKYGFGPKLAAFLEQGGIPWQPARFVHLSVVLFLAGFGVGWMLLPVGRPLAVLIGLGAGCGP